MSDLDKALSDYTTTICMLLDEEFPKPKPPTFDLDLITDVADEHSIRTVIGANHPSPRHDGEYEIDRPQGFNDGARPPSNSTKKRRKVKENTINPLKVMGKLTVLATLAYAVFIFFF